MEPNSVEKIVEIDSHIGITTSCNVVNTSIKWNLPGAIFQKMLRSSGRLLEEVILKKI